MLEGKSLLQIDNTYFPNAFLVAVNTSVILKFIYCGYTYTVANLTILKISN
jgi:hypothetical protein